MGVTFGEAHGSAKKSGLEYIKLEEGINRFRMVGELLPRYCYWKKLKTNSIPVECLSFNRKKEEFDNLEKDWFRHYFPDVKCVWSYVIQVIDLRDGKLKLCGLKKKLFDQIQTAANKLGDPTDIEEGWDILVEKKKTGPAQFNVEYVLLQLELEKRPLTEKERETIAEIKPIDEIVKRQTADEQKAFIEQAWLSDDEPNVDNEAVSDLD